MTTSIYAMKRHSIFHWHCGRMMRKWKELQWPECFPHDIFTGMGYYECNICGEKIEMPPIEQAAKN